ncbi:tyrosine-type recombinase/integrase [Acinetobacter sp. ANC 5380]|uniref:Tyrosine-type recombinase/integrase n=1 Tax=Acinetobacter terrae TaxID=2731247 RepID=A0A7Y2WC10_9GAMM|nr:tyrosine-type recombinase/integrase [Acinetobacter terrae]NNH78844.1 tyrosine-type recombinase/integrase [Acinetobacter terrae]
MLTESQAKKAKPKDKTYQLSVGDGLSLVVDKTGQKYWKLRYKDLTASRKVKRLGEYPALSLRDAKTETIKFLAEVQTQLENSKSLTFSVVAKEWISFKEKSSLGDKPLSGVLELAKKCIEREFEARIGKLKFSDIKRLDLVKVIRQIESRGVKEPCRKACSYLNQIYDYAVTVGYVEYNIAMGLNRILVKSKIRKNYPHIKNRELISFYQKIDQSKSHHVVRKALQLKTLTGVRGAELINTKFGEFDLEKGLWNIPAIRVKQYRRKVIEGHNIPDYVVPLSRQAVEVVRSAMDWSYGSEYVFSSPTRFGKPIHFNSLGFVIKAMGYSGSELTPHGLRSSMSTVLNESNLFKSEWIEAQLSHADKNIVRGTYNHADYLDQRAGMMQWWADYLTSDV